LKPHYCQKQNKKEKRKQGRAEEFSLPEVRPGKRKTSRSKDEECQLPDESKENGPERNNQKEVPEVTKEIHNYLK
jgi:hypothetical protein